MLGQPKKLENQRPIVSVHYGDNHINMELEDKEDVNLVIELIELMHQKYDRTRVHAQEITLSDAEKEMLQSLHNND